MSERALLFVAMIVGAVCAALPAQAKMVGLGTVSRVELKISCDKVGGEPYGIDDPNSEFGCKAHKHGIISCTPVGACQLIVGDLVPVTGNSLTTIFGLGPAQALAVLPANSRLQQPLPLSWKVNPIQARSLSSPIVPLVPVQPDPVQTIPNSNF
jgi:hypothetical protein